MTNLNNEMNYITSKFRYFSMVSNDECVCCDLTRFCELVQNKLELVRNIEFMSRPYRTLLRPKNSYEARLAIASSGSSYILPEDLDTEVYVFHASKYPHLSKHYGLPVTPEMLTIDPHLIAKSVPIYEDIAAVWASDNFFILRDLSYEDHVKYIINVIIDEYLLNEDEKALKLLQDVPLVHTARYIIDHPDDGEYFDLNIENKPNLLSALVSRYFLETKSAKKTKSILKKAFKINVPVKVIKTLCDLEKEMLYEPVIEEPYGYSLSSVSHIGGHLIKEEYIDSTGKHGLLVYFTKDKIVLVCATKDYKTRGTCYNYNEGKLSLVHIIENGEIIQEKKIEYSFTPKFELPHEWTVVKTNKLGRSSYEKIYNEPSKRWIMTGTFYNDGSVISVSLVDHKTGIIHKNKYSPDRKIIM